MLFLFLGTLQLQSQISTGPIDPVRACASISVMDQVCNEDGTVTISFRVTNNTASTATYVNVFAGSTLVGSSNSPIGPYSTGVALYTYTGATPGTVQCFEIYLYNRRGRICRQRACVRVQNCCTATCDDFTFTSTANNNFNIGVPIVSNVTASIGVTLDALRVPDSVWVTVNNVTVLGFSAGAPVCPGPTGLVVGPQYFTVQPCDVVVFNVLGDHCNLAASYWELYVECRPRRLTSGGAGDIGKGNVVTNPYSHMSEAELIETERSLLGLPSQEQANLNSEDADSGSAELGATAGALKIFPNPVNDVLNITNYNQEINYSEVRVIDGAGRTMMLQNMSGMLDLRMDASALQSGIYFIEVTDDEGNRVVEKFIKL